MRATVALAALLFGAGTVVHAQTISQPAFNAQGSATNSLGQSFTATLTGFVSSVAVRVSPLNPRASTLRIYAGAAGSGTSGSIGTPDYTQPNVALVDSNNSFFLIPLTTPFPVVAGNSYTFTLDSAVLLFSLADSYAGGTFVGNYAQIQAASDLAFQVFETLNNPQVITFNTPGAQTVGTTPAVTATADSGLVPVFSSSTPAVCTVTTGGALTLVAPGSCTVNANQAGNATFGRAAQVSQTFAVVQAAQTISFASPGPQILGTSPVLVATASSGLVPSFTSGTPAVCSVAAGGTLTLIAAGNCTINADQAGNAIYAAAPQVARTFAVAVPVTNAIPTLQAWATVMLTLLLAGGACLRLRRS